jgi:hypothetical protein
VGGGEGAGGAGSVGGAAGGERSTGASKSGRRESGCAGQKTIGGNGCDRAGCTLGDGEHGRVVGARAVGNSECVLSIDNGCWNRPGERASGGRCGEDLDSSESLGVTSDEADGDIADGAGVGPSCG